jgi:choline dehydrogenase-like flavoprotein
LAEDPNVSVLLLEAGGEDDIPAVIEASKWPMNLGIERDWSFQAQPNPRLSSVPLSMGKVLGGGSSINVMVWARGHKSDWDFFASEAEDPAWSYESVLKIIVASKIGTSLQTQSIAEQVGQCLSSPRSIPTRSLLPGVKEQALVLPLCAGHANSSDENDMFSDK